MPQPVKWELRPEQIAQPGRIEEFKAAYLDHSISLTLLSDTFGITSKSICHEIAKRLGIAVRPPAKVFKPKEPIDHDAQIQALEAQLTEARLAKAKAQLHFTWEDDHTLVIHGIGPDFRRLEGLPRLGEFLAKTKGW